MRVERLSANVDDAAFLKDISLAVPSRELHVLLGPSGCGKTTLLKTLAGLHPHTAGKILLDDRDVTVVPPERRGLVLLHQESTLFPHLDVAHNVAFGMRLRGRATSAVRGRVKELLDVVDLPGFGRRRMEGLSGGEKQRVQLARALAVEPQVLLLDEPFSALDRSLRVALRNDVRRILRTEGVTALYVTHDQEEAFSLGDALLVMKEGALVDRGPVARVFRDPANAESARVLGRRNVWPFTREAGGGLRTPVARFMVDRSDLPSSGTVIVREEDVSWALDPLGPEEVVAVEFLGTRTTYTLRAGPGVVTSERPGPPMARVGDKVRIRWDETSPNVVPTHDGTLSNNP